MHNERLKRIAKFLGTQGLYKEANNLTKVAMANPFSGEAGESAYIHEAYRAVGEEGIKKDLEAKVKSAIERGMTAEEIEAIFALGSEKVKQILEETPARPRRQPPGRPAGRETGEFNLDDPDDINKFIIPG